MKRYQPKATWTIQCKYCGRDVKTNVNKKMFCNNRCKCSWHNERERNRIKDAKVDRAAMS